jgi:ribosomal-protein-alanine N-acetyltransferase
MELNLNCFEHFPVLQTKRISLRRIILQDAERIFEMRKNSRNNEFILRPNMEHLENAKELINNVESGYKKREKIAWAGILRDHKEIIGTCGFNHVDHQNLRAEIGGELFINYWGKNIALEVANEIISFGFLGMQLNSIEAKVNPANRSAIYLLERLGFNREGYFKKHGFYNNSFHDLAVYSKLNTNSASLKT